MSATEEFTRACGTEMPFGKYKGETIARIASSDEGLKYLDWLIGQGWPKSPIRDAVWSYLNHPDVARRLDWLTGDMR